MESLSVQHPLRFKHLSLVWAGLFLLFASIAFAESPARPTSPARPQAPQAPQAPDAPLPSAFPELTLPSAQAGASAEESSQAAEGGSSVEEVTGGAFSDLPAAPVTPAEAESTERTALAVIQNAEAPPVPKETEEPPTSETPSAKADIPAFDLPLLPGMSTPNTPANTAVSDPNLLFSDTAPKAVAPMQGGGALAPLGAPVAGSTKKSWETRLAPTHKLPPLGYNYRRQLLPHSLYAKSYARDNMHLPVRVNRSDYERLLLMKVASNDVETTRALLNAGASLQVRTAEGYTALQIAQAYGAKDTEALLRARGASF